MFPKLFSIPVKRSLSWFGLELRKKAEADPPSPDIPDAHLYRPHYSPWLGDADFEAIYKLAAPRTLVSRQRCHVLYTMVRQSLSVPGDIWECGVYQGGTAAMIAGMLAAAASKKKLLLFDTFEGMPQTDPTLDLHRQGDFGDTHIADVKNYVANPEICRFLKGWIPETFHGLEAAKIAFAHIDLDIYRSVFDCIDFVWPRLSAGGVVVFDDYGFRTCPGARAAVDDYFAKQDACPLCLSTGQALVFKSR